MNSDNFQARLSSLVKPRDGACLNVMDAEAFKLQEQHRNRHNDFMAQCATQQRFAARATVNGETNVH